MGILFSVFVWFVVSMVCGFISLSLCEDKGYYKASGFFWGFVFWVVGIIICAARPHNQEK